MSGKSAIVGIGTSALTREFTGHAGELAKDALTAALADAGLEKRSLDGLLLNISPAAGPDVLSVFGLDLPETLGIATLRMLSIIESQGSTLGQMLRIAQTEIDAGRLDVVACVFADTPLRPERSGASAYASTGATITGVAGLDEVSGIFGAASRYGLVAARYLYEADATERELATVTMSNRQWAALNPQAFQRKQLTIDDYLAARYVCQPLRLVDCAFPVNGSVAVILARDSDTPDASPIYIRGIGEAHAGAGWRAGTSYDGSWSATQAAERAFADVKLDRADMGVLQVYDPFSFVAPLLLERYGFCEPGRGLEPYLTGDAGPGGGLPVNTGGGQTASHYLQGFTPMLEAVRQLRGDGGERQVPHVEAAFVGLVGGVLEHHGCVILSVEPN